ncbi:hypothetical protein AMR41_26225 [Hapalosiphon sp. MRB220]|nr:hypothetical protein AMR41_26225 [Hapalosiphon sp. MRB220]
MSKPITYWGCDYTVHLIKDVCESFGYYLQDLNESDALWLISRIAHEAWLERKETPSPEAEEIIDRLHELDFSQKTALIQAIANS